MPWSWRTFQPERRWSAFQRVPLSARTPRRVPSDSMDGKRLEIYTRADWQMSPGERAAFEGVLAQLQPRLAIEIGTAEGGSLERIAANSADVHAVDLTDERLVECPP